jgi:hypothetical protein
VESNWSRELAEFGSMHLDGDIETTEIEVYERTFLRSIYQGEFDF